MRRVLAIAVVLPADMVDDGVEAYSLHRNTGRASRCYLAGNGLEPADAAIALNTGFCDEHRGPYRA